MKDHNPQAHRNFKEYLAKNKREGKKAGIKKVEIGNDANPNTNTDTNAIMQSQAQNLTRSDIANMQVSIKALSERQALADDARSCFTKMFSPTDGTVLGCVKVQEEEELNNGMHIN